MRRAPPLSPARRPNLSKLFKMPHTVHSPNSKATARHTPQLKRPQNGGFALVIALSLMAFVLLLLLSITTLVQVETRSAETQKEKLQAQQNALLGLKLALGDLQKLSGADQRITASAEIFDTDASTVDIEGVEHPNWVGVWDSAPGLPHLNDRLDTTDPYYNYNARRDGSDNRFLGWLVSGNQDNITDRGSAIAPADEVLIFGDDFDESDPEQVANQVRVEKVPVTAGSATAGNYAYWVSDENTKTQINGYEPSTNGLSADILQRSRFVINQRSALEKVGRIGDNQFDPLSEPSTQAELKKLVIPEDLALLLPGSDESSIQPYTPALSTSAKGLLTNTYTSGLRTDLSSLLRQPITGASLSGIPAYLEGGTHRFVKYPPAAGGFPAPPAPSWEQMQSYASTTADQATALNARKQTATQSGYYPIMTRYSMKLVPTLVEDPAGNTVDLLIEPKIALVNPYSVPLDLGNSMYVHLFLEERDVNNDLGIEIVLTMHKGGAPNPWQGWPVDFLQNSALTNFTDPNGIIYNGFTFKLPDITMAPGEVLSFGVQNDQAPYTGENLMEVGTFQTGAKYVKLQMTDLSGAPQRATPEWSSAPISGHVTAWTYVNPLIHYGADLQVQNPKLESGEGTRQREILPFNISVGLSDTATPLDPEDFYHLAAGFESSNPNAVGRYIRGGGAPKYARSHGSNVTDYTTYSGMEPAMSLIIDTVLAGGFDYPLNNVETGLEPVAYGYRIDHRWLRGQNFRAPWHLPTATDHVEKAPNLLYGTATMFGMWRSTGGSDLGDMQLDGDRAYWGTGFDINDGVTQTAFYDVPDPTIGLLSLGQLQHMQISQISSSAPYGIGTGVVEMKIGDTGQLYQNSNFQAPTTNAFLPVDQNFLANNAIWDGFFFSGLSGAIQPAEIESWSHVPLNRRYEFTADAAPSKVNAPKEAASTLLVDGSFNINSTNKEAWKAVLAGANTLPFDPVTGADGTPLQSPISRSASPLAGSSNSNLNLLNGFRELTSTDDTQLDSLAENIVNQIKQRGPFLSLADFVNRRLETGNTEQGLYGPLEAALRRLNFNTQITGTEGDLLDEFSASDLPIWAFKPDDHINEVFEGPRGEDISQWVTQGDILQRIAPFISARGDTFTIRAYGETTDPISGKKVAEARCEATVQRVYEYVDRTNSSDQARYIFNNGSEQFEDGNLSPTNATFGRRYKIIHLRWL